MTIVLGIESTAHTFGIGIIKDGKVLVNLKKSYSTEDGEGGMIPNEVAKHHASVKYEIYENALNEGKINEKDISVIAFSQGPGLAPCLLEGIKFAKELSLKLKKPIVGVNHCIAHLEIGKITGAKDPVMLYASGANTQVIAYASGKYRIFGETLDIGVGNFIDNFARYAGIGFPGGPKIEQLAKNGKYIELPYKVKGMDIALSGILTNLKQRLEKGENVKDLSYSLQETVFAMLVEVSERALAHVGKRELLLGGGVACNSRLQEMCRIMCSEREDLGETKFFCPERGLLVDNGAMIAFLGEIMFKANANVFSYENLDKLDILPKQRTDDVIVSWR
jgi:glycoprotease/Kae1 family metallohydrolase